MNKKTERVLRKMAGNGYPEIKEALTEIERLRGELGIWKSVFPDLAPNEVQPDRSSLLQEIERLRKTLDDHLESEAAETRRADRERDRARKAEAEVVELTRALGRARLALQAIVRRPGADREESYELRKIAREALDAHNN